MNNGLTIQTTTPKDYYGSKLTLSIFILFAMMLLMMYKIQFNQPSDKKAPSHAFVPPTLTDKPIYLLTSAKTALSYTKNGGSAEIYKSNQKRFLQLLTSMGYSVKLLPSSKISTLPKESILLAIDTLVLSKKEKEAIKTFLKNGGSLFFNFTTGFSDEKGNYLAESFVKDITNLHLSPKGFVSITGDGGLFMTQKLLSPFTLPKSSGKLLSVVLYDKIPIYITPANTSPDIFATSYNQTTPPTAKEPSKNFTSQEAGLAWHGYYGKGKWVYTSLPGYSFYDIQESKEAYQKIVSGIITFLSQETIVLPFPYIDQKSAIFISEDTEYKFENFAHFASLSKEYKIPVTAFLVASLAQNKAHQEMVKKIAKENPFVEFASHSTSHKKIVGESESYIINETKNSKTIIDSLSHTPIQGFRPPREELNALMKKYLADSGFTYVLGASKEFLYPQFDKKEPNLLYIPRHGTDDYSYLVNLDWDQQSINQHMQKEARFVTHLNGIYTLSVHTHLFSYSTNINIIRNFYKFLHTQPDLKPLQGKEIYHRIQLMKHLKCQSEKVNNQLIITLTNDNQEPIKNLSLQLFKNPNLKIANIAADTPNTYITPHQIESTLELKKIAPKSTLRVFLTLKGS